MRALIATAAAAAALLAAAGPAGAVQTAEFKVTFKGVQTNTWDHSYTPQFACDVGLEGSGKETWRFWSSKPSRIRAIRTPRGVFLTGPRGPATVLLGGRLTRAGHLNVIPGAVCAEGDGTGGTSNAPPDCGRIQTNGFVNLEFDSRRRSLLTLAIPGETGQRGSSHVFENCPTRGDSWPNLLAYDGRAQRIGQRLPASDLFEHGKSIVVARGRKVLQRPTGTSTTTVRWEVSFTRIGAAR
jgi:hypothetical protein